jgi:CENP-B N-terminal DNA-binding domain
MRQSPKQYAPQITDDMRAEAAERRRNGAANGVVAREVPDTDLPMLNEPETCPEDYRDYWQQKADEDATPRPMPKPNAEYRNGGWYRMSDGKRVYTLNEKREAIELYRTGLSAGAVGAKFGLAPATVRTWAKRDRDRDRNAHFPRFMA